MSISVPLIGLLESVSLNMTGSLRDDVDCGVRSRINTNADLISAARDRKLENKL